MPIANGGFVYLKRCLKQWLRGGGEFVEVVLGQGGRILLFFCSLLDPAQLDAMWEAAGTEGLGCAALCPGWHSPPGRTQQVKLPAKGSPGDPSTLISVYGMKSGSRGLLQHCAGGFQQELFLSGERLNAPAWAALPSSNGSLLRIWGCFVCVARARALLFRQLAGNGDEGSLNSLLIKDQWLYCEKNRIQM